MDALALLLIGNELLAGEVRDENGPAFLKRARERGVRVCRVHVVPDEAEAILEALTALHRVEQGVVVSGGIGPTHDDPTREAVARFLNVPLERHAEAEARLRAIYGSRVVEAELAMADLPRGASLVEGMHTSAFGFVVGGIFALPGVPPLFADLIETIFDATQQQPMASHSLWLERREGEVAGVLAAVQAAAPHVGIGSYPVLQAGDWKLRVTVRGPSPAAVASVVALLEARLAAIDAPTEGKS